MVDASIPLHTNLLVLETQEEWIAKLEGLVEEHGLSTVENWCDERDKHNHHLIHLAVHKNATQVIKVMVSELGFDPNIHRGSDKCTPLHLAIWFSYPEMVRLLISYGADQSLENSYKEPCDVEYEKHLKSCRHIRAADAIEVLVRNSHVCNEHLDSGIPSSCQTSDIMPSSNQLFAEQCWLQTHAATLEMSVQHQIQADIIGNFCQQGIARIALVCARAGRNDEWLFAALATAAKRCMENFDSQSLANTAWAFAKAGRNDASLFAALATASERCLGDFKPQGLANTAWAFATAS